MKKFFGVVGLVLVSALVLTLIINHYRAGPTTQPPTVPAAQAGKTPEQLELEALRKDVAALRAQLATPVAAPQTLTTSPTEVERLRQLVVRLTAELNRRLHGQPSPVAQPPALETEKVRAEEVEAAEARRRLTLSALEVELASARIRRDSGCLDVDAHAANNNRIRRLAADIDVLK